MMITIHKIHNFSKSFSHDGENVTHLMISASLRNAYANAKHEQQQATFPAEDRTMEEF